jgi:beta-lactamase regulating signal transducer with metallopeptidase domain
MTAILLVLKATALVVVALLLTRLGERRAPAALRALVLTGTLAALLILPIAALVLPPLSVPMTPRLAGLFEATPTTVPDADVSIVVVESGQPLGAGAAAESLRGDRRPAADASTFSVVAVVRLVWLAGVLIVGVRLAIGLWTLRRLRRTAAPWPEGAAVARHLLGEGVAARTAIVLQPNVDAPVTYGLLRPLVALPPDAPQWPASDLRRALIHELEHVRRADWATQVFAQVVCALYWFHPLVWVAARRLRLAMEQACDDAVRAAATAKWRLCSRAMVMASSRASISPAWGWPPKTRNNMVRTALRMMEPPGRCQPVLRNGCMLQAGGHASRLDSCQTQC